MKPPDEWLVLIQNHHPAYISWEQYQCNVTQLQANPARANERGTARRGSALLAGLLVCGRCGHRMTVQYHQAPGDHQYVCSRDAVDYGGHHCQCLSGACLDDYVVKQVLRALEPAAVEISLSAAEHLEKDRSELDTLWRQRLERARFEAERAGRHYRLVEPENRLVARQLAQEWEAKLQAHQCLHEEYERFCAQQPKSLSAEEQRAIRQLAHTLPRLWAAQTTTAAQRKEIVRQMVETIMVAVEGESEQVQVRIHWVGGAVCQAHICRPVAKWTQLSNYTQLCQRLEHFAQANLSTDEIIERLHQEGFHPPKRRQTFNRDIVGALMRRLGLRTRRTPTTRESLTDHEWWLPDLAAELGMPTPTLYAWVKRGWVNAWQRSERPKHWIIWADKAELERLKRHRQYPTGEILRQRWHGEIPGITTPPKIPHIDSR